MCECTAHLFFSRSVGGHTQRAPPGANLLPALLTPPSRSGTARGHSCHAARDIHTSTDCHQPLLSSPLRQVWALKHTNVCLGICSGAEQMQFCWELASEAWKNVVLSAGAPTQVVSALKLHMDLSEPKIPMQASSLWNFWSCTVLPSCKLRRKKVHSVLL